MTAFKRFISLPAFITSCIVALWVLCLAGTLLLYPIASQTTKVYRLGIFSVQVLPLILHLQLERAVSAGFVATDQAEEFTGRLQTLYKQTDGTPPYRLGVDVLSTRTRRHGVLKTFEKAWSRFNSSDFEPALANSLEATGALLAQLSQMRSRVSTRTAGVIPTIEFYTDAITKLSATILHLETLKLDLAAADKSRNAYLRIVKANELAAREMAIGLVLVAGGAPGKQQEVQWRTLPAEQSALLALYKTYLDPPKLTQFKAWEKSSVKMDADNMRDRLRAAFLSSQPIISISMADWFETFALKQSTLLEFAMIQYRDVKTKTGSVAARTAYFFVTCILVTLIATLGAIALCRPAALRQSLLICLVLFNLALTVWALTAGPDWLAHENGPIEILQVVALGFAFVLFCLAAAKEPGAPRTAAVAIACLCLLMLLREIDFRTLNAPEWLITTTTGDSRRLFTWLAGAITLIYVLSRFRHLPSLIRSSLTWKAWPFYLWFPLLMAGEKIEAWTNETRKDAVHGYWTNGQFWEELFELNSYIMLLLAAYIFSEIYKSSARRNGSRDSR